MNKTIPAVAAAALALYLDRAARRRHREHIRALQLYRTSVDIRNVSILPDRNVPGPYISVDGPHGDVLHPTVAARVAAAARAAKPSWLSKPAPAVGVLDGDGYDDLDGDGYDDLDDDGDDE